MVRQGKSLLRVTPVRWGPVATGFPALGQGRLVSRNHIRSAEIVSVRNCDGRLSA